MALSCKTDEYKTSDGFCVACPQFRRGCLTHKELNPDVYKSCLDCTNFQSITEVDHSTKILIICVCVGAVVMVIVVLGLIYKWKKQRSRNTAHKNKTSTGTKAPKQHDDGGNTDNNHSLIEENMHQQLNSPNQVKALDDAYNDPTAERRDTESLQGHY